MQTAKKGDTVIIEYVVKTSEDNVVGGTDQEGPQTVKIGGAEIFPQIEAALDGMTVGDQQTVTIPAAEAFGLRREEMVVDIPRESLPADPAPQPGMALSAQQPDGSTVQLVIVEVGEEAVKADANHPLAGQDLTFGLTLVEIKDAA